MKTLIPILAAALSISFTVSVASAQAPAPATPSVSAPQASPLPPTAAGVPSAPSPQAAGDLFPPVNPKFFTATSPSAETVNTFLKALWGYDPNRLWRVMAIQTTPAAGVAKVVVFVMSKSPGAKIQGTTFYVLPDGKHAVGDASGVVPFGATPFTATRDLLKTRVNGAARGAAGNDLLIVEFADFQCAHCKDAQDTMDRIVKDFPNARVVFQPFPLVDVHPAAFKASAYGVCAQKQSNDAFFKYVGGVFETQDALSPATEDTILRAAAMRAGLDGAAIAACAATPATRDIVTADMKLGEDAAIEQTPMLSVNGRVLPLTIPYESLKQIIIYQAMLDGVPTGASAETLSIKPSEPALTTLPK